MNLNIAKKDILATLGVAVVSFARGGAVPELENIHLELTEGIGSQGYQFEVEVISKETLILLPR